MKYLLPIIMVLALTAVSCFRPGGRSAPADEDMQDQTLFDPLAQPEDREVVPEVYPVTIAAVPGPGDSLVSLPAITPSGLDSTESAISPAEVYRIQIFTSRLYAEANREWALAEEIFNLPVHLDYEVPYYKLRVGDFITRSEAEEMVSEIRAIGYRNAWVARVVLRIRDVPEFNLSDEPILPTDSGSYFPPPENTPEQPDEEDNR